MADRTVDRKTTVDRTVTLLLNATYEPLGVVSSRRAVVLIVAEKAVLVEDGDGAVHSVTRTIPVPAVVRLTRYVRVPYRGHVPLTRRAVFARDGGRCAYCEAPATSLDHVIPRSRGGTHTWDNVVASCRRCNHTKADRAIADLGWRLRTTPRAPSGPAWRILGHRAPDPRWHGYLRDVPLVQTQVSA
jgi:5-methylcytosine-specific restriction endonuclease McrA